VRWRTGEATPLKWTTRCRRERLRPRKGMHMSDEKEAQEQIATLLHELRQPLNMIMLSCNNVQNRAKIENGDLSEIYLINKMDQIISAVRKASMIIEKIKTISTQSEKS
jgi:signal transduction histidine kinase